MDTTINYYFDLIVSTSHPPKHANVESHTEMTLPVVIYVLFHLCGIVLSLPSNVICKYGIHVHIQ